MSMDSVTGAQFLSSLSVCSSPRVADPETMSNRSEDEYASGLKVKLMCSYGGRILPRPHDAQLRYVGGETRILVVNRNISFAEFSAKLAKLCGGRQVFAKYKLPYEDMDALISIVSDEDLESMVEEYDRLDARDAPSRLRVFLFPIDDFTASAAAAPVAATTTTTSSPLLQPLDPKLSRFVEALNYGPPPGPQPPPPPPATISSPNFLFEFDQPAPVESIHGSTSSSNASEPIIDPELGASAAVPPPPASLVLEPLPQALPTPSPAAVQTLPLAQIQIQAPPSLPPIRAPNSAQAQAQAAAPSSQSQQVQASSSPQQQHLPPRGPKPSAKPGGGGDKKDKVRSSPSSPSAVDWDKAWKNAIKDKDLSIAPDSAKVPSPGHLVEERQSPPPPPQQQPVDFAAALEEKLKLMNAGDSEDEHQQPQQGMNSRPKTGTGTFSPTREMSLNVFMEQQHKEEARPIPLHDKMLKFAAVDNDKLVVPPSPPVPPPTEPPVKPQVAITEAPFQPLQPPQQPSYQYVAVTPGAYHQGQPPLTQHQPYYVDGNMIYLLPADAFPPTQQQQRPIIVSSDMQRGRTAGTPIYQRQTSSGSGTGSSGYLDQQPMVLPPGTGTPTSAAARVVYYPVPLMPRPGIHQAPPSRFRGEGIPLAALNMTPQQIQLQHQHQHQQLVEDMPVRLPGDRV